MLFSRIWNGTLLTTPVTSDENRYSGPAARNGTRFSALVTGIVQSTPFRMKRIEGGTAP